MCESVFLQSFKALTFKALTFSGFEPYVIPHKIATHH
jgi:hypothetical protein